MSPRFKTSLSMLAALALLGTTGCPTTTPGDDDDDATGDDDDDDDATGDDDDDDSTPSACTDSSECEGWQFCDDGTCVDGDENNSPEEAGSMEIDTQVAGYINPAADLDYYSFSCVSGTYLVIYTEANPDDDPSRLDSAISLWDADGNMIAENDDYCATCGATLSRSYATDSYIFWRCPDDETYTLQVEEWSTWQTDYPAEEYPPEGDPSYFYTLVVTQFNTELLETEPNDAGTDEGVREIGSLDEATGNATIGLAAGEITGGTDVDIYTVPVPSPGEDPNAVGMVNAWLYPLNGSTLSPEVGLWMADGVTQLCSNDISNEYRGISAPVPVADTSYAISVSDNSGLEGDNDFYFMHAWGSAIVNTVETEPNDDVGSANSLDTSAGSDYGRGSLDDGDTDVWSISATAGQTLYVGVGAEGLGSSVDSLLRVLDGEGNEVTSSDDGDNDLDPAVDGFSIPADGVYFLEFTPVAVDGPLPFYYFGVTLN